MAGQGKKFRFLTLEEFNRLSRSEKIAYLDKATAEISGKGRRTDRSPFRDGPSRSTPRKK